MVLKEEFTINRNTVYLASIIMDDFYSDYVLGKGFNFGKVIDDNVKRIIAYQINLNQFKEENQVSDFERIRNACRELNPYYNKYDFTEINEDLLLQILKKSINCSSIEINDGYLTVFPGKIQ